MALGQVGSMAVALLGDINDFTKKMDTAEGKVSSFDKSVAKMGKDVTKAAKAAAVAAAAAVTAFGVSAVKTFVDFDTGMRQVFTLMPDLSAEAKDVMIEDVMELSEAIGIIPSEIIPALYQAISAGVPRENVFTYLEVAGEAAIGGAVELEGMVVALAQVMNAYGSEVDQARSYSDMFFSIIADGLTTMEELSTELFKVAPVAADVGIAFSGIAGWMAELTSQGVPAAEAASYMKVALNELSKAGTIASDTFEKAAGVTFPAFIASGGDIVDAFGIIDQYAQDSNISVKDMFGSIEAGGAVLMATGVHFDSFSEKVGNAEEAAGKTTDAYTEMAAGIQRELDGLAAWWERLKIDIGGDLTENLQDLLGWLEENREAIGDGIKAIFDGLIDGLEWMQKNGDAVKNGLIAVGIGLAAIVFYTNPLLAITAALAGLIAVLSSDDGLPGTVNEMRDFNAEIDNMIVGLEGASKSNIVGFIRDYYEGLTDTITEMKNLGTISKDVYGDIVKELFNLQSDVLQLAPEDMADAFVLGSDIILSKFAEIHPELEELRLGYIETGEVAGDFAQSQIDAVGEVQRVLAEYRASQDQTAQNSVLTAQLITGSWDAIGDASETAADEIVESTANIGFGLIELTEKEKAFAALHQAWLDAFVDDTTEANDEIQSSYEQMWEGVKNDAANALVSMVEDFASYGSTREQEEEDHQAELARIREEYDGQSQAALEIALGIQESKYKAHRTTIGGVLRDMFGDFVSFIADELLAMAAAETVKSIASFLSLNPVQGTASALAAGQYAVGAAGVAILASSIPGYAEGGIIPGPAGEPTVIMAHGQERILNEEQQDALAIDYSQMGAAVYAGTYDALKELEGEAQPVGASNDFMNRLAQSLYPALQTESERRGGGTVL